MFVPNRQQLKAISHVPGPLMIIAGAGTGKTSTLIHRIQYLIQSTYATPKHIVVLTFTEKATDELQSKIKEILGQSGSEILIATFHSFCNRLVREFGRFPDAERLLFTENDIKFLLLSRFDSLTFLTSHNFRVDPVQAVTNSFIPFFNRIRDELLSPDDIIQKGKYFPPKETNLYPFFPSLSEKVDSEELKRQFSDLIMVYQTYQMWKKELNVVDYGDLILDCWNMLKEDREILAKVRFSYRHILIDEYQDNNYALNKIVNLIMKKKPSITVVGDEDQCIYSFRGANYYNIQDFKNRYHSYQNYNVVKLEENYRSSQEILDLANYSISKDKNRTEKRLISALKKHGSKPVWYVGSRKQILRKIPELVNRLVITQKYQFGDVAIICRTWGHVKEIAKALQTASIPVDVYTEKFFNVPAVKDILAWGHLICGKTLAEAALFRILSQRVSSQWTQNFFRKMKKGKISTKLQQLEEEMRNNHLLSHEKREIKVFFTIIESLKKKLRQKRHADEMVWEILDETDLLANTRHCYRYMDRLNLVNVGHLLSLAETFCHREEDKSLKHWLSYMEVLQLDLKLPAIQPETYDQSIAVQVLTTHQSKGLEFPVVIIPFLRAGSFPLRRKSPTLINTLPEPWYQWQKPPDLTIFDEYINEERRIFFVALTRAKDQLFLFGPNKVQSLFTKELEESTQPLMEIIPMSESQLPQNENQPSPVKQQLLVELNREISAHQYENAIQIIKELRTFDEEGKLPQDSIFSNLYQQKGETDLTRDWLHLSASSVEEYSRCPRKYRLSKIDRVPERKSKVTMEFGIIIHNVLEEFHSLKKQTLENLLDLLNKHWRTEAFEYFIREEEFKRQGEKILKDYFDYLETNPPSIVTCERPFEFVLEDQKIKISGKIDRIDQDGAYLSVIDYKTSQNKESAKNSLQLALYVEAIHRKAVEGITGKPRKAILHFLRHPDDPLSYHEFSSVELRKHLQKVTKVAKGIRNRLFDPIPNDYFCQHCDYREFLCPAWEDR